MLHLNRNYLPVSGYMYTCTTSSLVMFTLVLFDPLQNNRETEATLVSN